MTVICRLSQTEKRLQFLGSIKSPKVNNRGASDRHPVTREYTLRDVVLDKRVGVVAILDSSNFFRSFQVNDMPWVPDKSVS